MSAQTLSATPKIPRTFAHHGDVRVDGYCWLRDRSNPDVIAYLEAENRYGDAKLEHTEPLQKQLYDEMLGRIRQTGHSVPEQIGEWLYTRTEEGKRHPIYGRKGDYLESREEILLDANALAQGHGCFRIGAVKVSPNHELLACSTDTDGFEVYTLRIKGLKTGRL